ncbi:MAG TPA: TIM barrel protein [Burkholderiaceae bacterium]|nr:TIM barrel protein [Burkholderiaceae bacterium]
MQLAANLSLLYAGLPVAERFAAARDDGFRYVEVLAPYDQAPQWYADQLRAHDLELVLINTPVMSDNFPTGLAAQPGKQSLFQAAMQRAVQVCQATGCCAIHVMAGNRDQHYSHAEQSATLKANLQWAANEWPSLTLHLEGLNQTDVPGYFYARPEHVAHELQQINHSRVGMQFDFYHVVKEGLSPRDQVERYFSYVRHVQIAGAPDRHEPNLQLHGLLAGVRQLSSMGYTGFLGLEYRPATVAREGLHWVQPLADDGIKVCHNATT